MPLFECFHANDLTSSNAEAPNHRIFSCSIFPSPHKTYVQFTMSYSIIFLIKCLLTCSVAGQAIDVQSAAEFSANKSNSSDTVFSVTGKNGSFPTVDLALEIPQTRPYLHTYLEYVIDFLFHRPMIDTSGPPDPLNSYLRPPNMRYCQCGIASNRIHRLDSRDNSPQLEFPWRVYIQAMHQYEERKCAGTLVSMSWVVTAASCIGDQAQTVVVSGVAETGECWSLRSHTWFIHPFYNEVTHDSDIALVKLEVDRKSPLVQSQTIQPICLPWKIRYRDFSKTTVTTSVWTSRSADCSAFSTLQKLTLPLRGSHECQMIMHRKNRRYPRITNNMVCTERESVGLCELPDYGGSLDYFDPDAKVSYMLGIPADPEHNCNGTDFYPHMGTRIVSFLDWIFNTAKDAEFCVL